MLIHSKIICLISGKFINCVNKSGLQVIKCSVIMTVYIYLFHQSDIVSVDYMLTACAVAIGFGC